MPDLSEFIAFVAEESGIKKPSLIEKDLIIHRILRDIYSSRHFAESVRIVVRFSKRWRALDEGWPYATQDGNIYLFITFTRPIPG